MKQFICATALLLAFVTLAFGFALVRFSVADIDEPVSVKVWGEEGRVRISLSESVARTARSVFNATWESLRALPFFARDAAELFCEEAIEALSLFSLLLDEGYGDDVLEI